MTLKNDENFLREIDLPFQNWRKGFDEFWLDHSEVSKIYALLGCFWRKYCLIYKSKEELSFMTLESDAKFEEKLTCDLENDMRNLANFHHSTRKSQIWDFDGILLSKVENV